MFDVRSGVRRAVVGALLIGLVPLPSFGASQPYGGATPQELVARMRAAAEADDIGELMACMAPEDRKAMGGTMVMMAVMMVGFAQMGAEMGGAMAEGMSEALGGEEPTAEEQAETEAQKAKAAAEAAEVAAKLRAALEPHGLAGLVDAGLEPEPGQEEAIEAALDQADMVALTESVMAVMAELQDAEGAEGEDGEGAALAEEEGKPDWLDVEVTDYVVDGDHATAQAGDETLEMIRIDGRWFFAPQNDMGMGTEEPAIEDGRVDGV